MKTLEEVEALKANWLNDPCYDIYDTEGFEEYREELLMFSAVKHAEWKAAYYQEHTFFAYLGEPDPDLRYADVEKIRDLIAPNASVRSSDDYASGKYEIWMDGKDGQAGVDESQHWKDSLLDMHPDWIIEYSGEWKQHFNDYPSLWKHGIRFYKPLTEKELARGMSFRLFTFEFGASTKAIKKQAAFEQKISEMISHDWEVAAINQSSSVVDGYSSDFLSVAMVKKGK